MGTMAEALARATTQSEMSSFFSDKMGLISVKAYGAVGDGVTDDTLAIQAAVDVAQESGNKLIYFPHGNYLSGELTNITGLVFLGDNSSFVGDTYTITQFGANSFDIGFVNVEAYGAVGDGVADDTEAIQTAVEIGGNVIFPKNKVYKVTDTINVTNSADINLNNSTINFSLTTTVPGFWVQSDNVKICNGTVDVVGTTMGGNGISLCCIVAGHQSTGVGYKHLRFTDLSVSTNRNDAGGAIGLLGECSNVLIENIYVPDNANCRNIIGCEWGGTAELGTGHPHDIIIRNVKAGKLTYPAIDFGYLVWLSSCFNVEISNLHAEECFGMVAVMCGERSSDYAPAEYKNLVGKNIKINNVACENIFGYGIRNYGRGSKSVNTLDLATIMTNISLKAKDGHNTGTRGVIAEYCKNIKLENFTLDGFYAGFVTGADCHKPTVENGKIINNKAFGLAFGNSGGACVNPVARNIHFQGNNTGGGTGAGTAAVTLTNTVKPIIEHCTFGEIGVSETQKYSITCTTDTINPRLNDNHTYNILTGGVSYVIGGSTNSEINACGANNTSEDGIANVGGAPIFQISPAGNRVFYGAAIPMAGAYRVGDTMYSKTPTAGGNIGATCITAGSPGTWKTFGVIAT